MKMKNAIILLSVMALGLGACTADAPIEEPINHDQADANDNEDADQRDDDVSDDPGGEEDAGTGEDTDGDGEDAGNGDSDAGDEDAGDEDAGDTDDPDAGDPDTGDDTGEPALEGDTCETAIDVTDEEIFIGESTVGMNDHYDPVMGAANCPGTDFSDRERVYVVSPDDPTTYEVVVEPEDGFDVMLYAREDCNIDACLAGTRFGGPGDDETMTFDAPGGESSYIFVDGEIGHAGDFDIMVTIED